MTFNAIRPRLSIKNQEYFDLDNNKVVKPNTKSKTTSPILSNITKKIDPIYDNIVPSNDFVFGKRYTPSATEIAEELTLGLFDPSVSSRINNGINSHNSMVMRRAKMLTYARDVAGVKFAPRMSMMGLGGGKLPIPIPPSIFPELPP